MNNAAEILKSIHIGLNVAIFLRNTDRGLRATDLFRECAILLQILGDVFHSLGEHQKAKENHEKALAIAIEIGDRKGEGTGYENLGYVFYSLGEHQKAKEYFEKALAIKIEIGNRKGEGTHYGNLGCVFHSLGEHQKAEEYYEKALAIAIDTGNRGTEGRTYGNLGHVFRSLGEYQKAKEYCEKALAIAIEIADRKGEETHYSNLGCMFCDLGEHRKAEEYHEKALAIAIEIGDRKGEGTHYGNLGTLLTHLLYRTGKFQDALYVEELGRARILAEFMAEKYAVESHISVDPQSWSGIENIVKRESNCVSLYISYEERRVLLWVLKANGELCFRVTDEVEVDTLIDEQVCNLEGIFKKSAAGFGVLPAANCEDRSLDDNVKTSLHDESRENLRADETKDTERIHHLCYKWIIAPVADLLTEPEIIIVPDRFLYRVPFALLRDEPAGKYLSEKYRIRIVPSLTTLRIIQESPADYHSQTDALVVGDPTVGEVYYNGHLTDITPLFCARKEAEMVGGLLGVQPLLGSRATKQAVLHAIPSVSLIHFAAHGNPKRGEIALSPQRTSNITPQEEDYLLTMPEIQGVQVRAKLVVLSCCHSGRGMVKKEGIIGIARAFLASGARSVLVASWAVEDEATEKLMKHFYKHLVRGESASESLHQAVQWLRTNGFPKPRQWAPFVLMGDNVTFDFTKKGKEELEEDNNEAEKKQSDY
ncbi:hypothetical protein pdam_00002607 [Pocillopora damicornis]|uniref:CHAT domain-containing protein n=1 Tax=Pocillopora damicornis TaxID=46731 RepID=A0A3M6U3J3_POCDA|nr:hypothetical protein pdam_00002607 [Pocillopora damicornis]